VICLPSCGSTHSPNSQSLLDSPTVLALDGTLGVTEVLVAEPDPAVDQAAYLKQQINEQLKFTMGHLNGYGALADLSSISVEILSNQKYSSDLRLVRYQAKLMVTWPKDKPVADVTLILPRRM